MNRCELLDYSDRDECLQPVVESLNVTQRSKEFLQMFVSQDKLEKMEEGDEIAIYRLNNPVEGISGELLILYSKAIACINTGNGNVWGDWDEDNELLLTEEFEEAKDEEGVAVMGRVAYNTQGIRGIYSRGECYTLFNEVSGQ